MEDQYLIVNANQNGEITYIESEGNLVFEQGTFSVIPNETTGDGTSASPVSIADNQTVCRSTQPVHYVIHPHVPQEYIVTSPQQIVRSGGDSEQQVYVCSGNMTESQKSAINQSVQVNSPGLQSTQSQTVLTQQAVSQLIVQPSSQQQQVVHPQIIHVQSPQLQQQSVIIPKAIVGPNVVQMLTSIALPTKSHIMQQPPVVLQGSMAANSKSATSDKNVTKLYKSPLVRTNVPQTQSSQLVSGQHIIVTPAHQNIVNKVKSSESVSDNAFSHGVGMSKPSCIHPTSSTSNSSLHKFQSFNLLPGKGRGVQLTHNLPSSQISSENSFNMNFVTSRNPNKFGKVNSPNRCISQPSLVAQKRKALSQVLAISQSQMLDQPKPTRIIINDEFPVKQNESKRLTLTQYRHRQENSQQEMSVNHKIPVSLVKTISKDNITYGYIALPMEHTLSTKAIGNSDSEIKQLVLCKHCGILSDDPYVCVRCSHALTPKESKSQIGTTSSYGGGLKNNEKEQNTSRNKFKGRSRGKIAEEPEVFTLSSDEDENSAKADQQSAVHSDAPSCSSSSISSYDIINKKEPKVSLEDNEYYKWKDEDLLKTVNEFKCDDSYTAIAVRSIRVGSYKVLPKEKVLFMPSVFALPVFPTSNDDTPKTPVYMCIPLNAVLKILVSYALQMPVFFFYLKPSFICCIRNVLKMDENKKKLGFYYDILSSDQTHRRITVLPENLSDENKSLVKQFYGTVTYQGSGTFFLEEITSKEANDILMQSSPVEAQACLKNIAPGIVANESKTLLIYPPPPQKGGISITTDDYCCLEEEQFLNDVIIDFYLNWLQQNVLTEQQRKKTHIFSTFFYNRLTLKPKERRNKNGNEEPKISAAEKRHARVKSWTKNVDIFEKDFIVIPINEHPVRAYDGAPMPVAAPDPRKKLSSRIKTKVEVPILDSEWSDRDEAEGEEDEMEDDDDDEDGALSKKAKQEKAIDSHIPGLDLASPEQKQKKNHYPIKQPCILVFDSLTGTNRAKIVATLRDYLTVEYIRKKGFNRIFNRDTMKGASPKVPQQMNYSDCGTYTLQFAEHFFTNPLDDYTSPIRTLSDWFPQDLVARKREAIASLIKQLVMKHNQSVVSEIPVIKFSSSEMEEKINDCEEKLETSSETMEQNSEVVNIKSACDGLSLLGQSYEDMDVDQCVSEPADCVQDAAPGSIDTVIVNPSSDCLASNKGLCAPKLQLSNSLQKKAICVSTRNHLGEMNCISKTIRTNKKSPVLQAVSSSYSLPPQCGVISNTKTTIYACTPSKMQKLSPKKNVPLTISITGSAKEPANVDANRDMVLLDEETNMPLLVYEGKEHRTSPAPEITYNLLETNYPARSTEHRTSPVPEIMYNLLETKLPARNSGDQVLSPKRNSDCDESEEQIVEDGGNLSEEDLSAFSEFYTKTCNRRTSSGRTVALPKRYQRDYVDNDVVIRKQILRRTRPNTKLNCYSGESSLS